MEEGDKKCLTVILKRTSEEDVQEGGFSRRHYNSSNSNSSFSSRVQSSNGDEISIGSMDNQGIIILDFTSKWSAV